MNKDNWGWSNWVLKWNNSYADVGGVNVFENKYISHHHDNKLKKQQWMEADISADANELLTPLKKEPTRPRPTMGVYVCVRETPTVTFFFLMSHFSR